MTAKDKNISMKKKLIRYINFAFTYIRLHFICHIQFYVQFALLNPSENDMIKIWCCAHTLSLMHSNSHNAINGPNEWDWIYDWFLFKKVYRLYAALGVYGNSPSHLCGLLSNNRLIVPLTLRASIWTLVGFFF